MPNFCWRCGAKLDPATGLCPNCDLKPNTQASAPNPEVRSPMPPQGMQSNDLPETEYMNAPIDLDGTVKVPQQPAPKSAPIDLDGTVKVPQQPAPESAPIDLDGTVKVPQSASRKEPPTNPADEPDAAFLDRTVRVSRDVFADGASEPTVTLRQPQYPQQQRYTLDPQTQALPLDQMQNYDAYYQPPVQNQNAAQYGEETVAAPLADVGYEMNWAQNELPVSNPQEQYLRQYVPQQFPQPEPEEEQPRGRKALAIFLVILILLILGAGAVVALSYFDKVDIPVVSDLIEHVIGSYDDKDDDKKDDGKTDSTQATSDAPASQPTSETEVTEAPQRVTISGVLKLENQGTSSEKSVLHLDAQQSFPVSAQYRQVYGDSFNTSEVQILKDGLEQYEELHITVTGDLKFDTENQSRKIVLLDNCTVKITEADKAYNDALQEEEEEKDAKPSYVGKNVKIKLDASENANLNVRSSPDYATGEKNVIGKVKNGSTVKVLDEKNGWVYIDYGDGKGWCSAFVSGIEADWSRVEDVLAVDTVNTSGNADSHGGGKASDGKASTCWIADSANGAWIQLDFGATQRVSGVKLLNGNCTDKTAFQNNGRVKKFTLEFSDGTTVSYVAKDTRESEYGANMFILDAPIETEYVKLRVDSSYSGKSSAVALSEFVAFE